MEPLKVGFRPYRIMGWGCLVVCVACVAYAAHAYWIGETHPYLALLACALFAVLAAYSVGGAGTFTLDDDAITHQTTFGTFRILWSEVKRIEVSQFSGALILRGENKSFTVPPFEMWSGPDRGAAHPYLRERLEKIPSYPSSAPDYKGHRNARIPNATK